MGKYITISKLSDDKEKVIKVEVTYFKGSYATPRGIYLKVQPMTLHHKIIEGEEYITEQWQHGTGYELLVKPLTRYSFNQLRTIGELINPEVENIVRMFQARNTESIKNLVNQLLS